MNFLGRDPLTMLLSSSEAFAHGCLADLNLLARIELTRSMHCLKTSMDTTREELFSNLVVEVNVSDSVHSDQELNELVLNSHHWM